MSKLSTYLTETREEMKHVTWPTRKQTFNFTMLVIFISIAVAVYLGFFDYVFSTVLKMFI